MRRFIGVEVLQRRKRIGMLEADGDRYIDPDDLLEPKVAVGIRE